MYWEGTKQYDWLDEHAMMLGLPNEWMWLEWANMFHLETLCIFFSRPGVKKEWRLAVPLCTQMVGNALSVPCPSILPQADSHVNVLEHPIPARDFSWFPLRRSRCYPSRRLGVCWRGLASAVSQEKVVEAHGLWLNQWLVLFFSVWSEWSDSRSHSCKQDFARYTFLD